MMKWKSRGNPGFFKFGANLIRFTSLYVACGIVEVILF